jgi:antitoxin MazE6
VRLYGEGSARGSMTDRGRAYTVSMKTAISIPDDVFQDAESLAQQLKISRSQLYSRALSEYVSRHAPDAVTESYDRVCEELGEEAKLDPFVAVAARRILERTE